MTPVVDPDAAIWIFQKILCFALAGEHKAVIMSCFIFWITYTLSASPSVGSLRKGKFSRDFIAFDYDEQYRNDKQI